MFIRRFSFLSPFLSVLLILAVAALPCAGHTVYPVRDFLGLSESVFTVDRKDVPFLAGSLLCASLAFAFDRSLSDALHPVAGKDFSSVLTAAKVFGDGAVIAGFGALNILAGTLAESRRMTVYGIYVLEGVVFSGIYVQAAKVLFGRERPYVKKDPYSFRPFSFRERNLSFYSGHTTEAFTWASITAHYFKNGLLSVLAYSAAALTGLQRVYDYRHWSSDVIVGAFTGILIGRKIVGMNKDDPAMKLDTEGLKVSFLARRF